jgi:hypothetical protein
MQILRRIPKELREKIESNRRVVSKLSRMDYDMNMAFPLYGLEYPNRWLDLLAYIDKEIREIESELSDA